MQRNYEERAQHNYWQGIKMNLHAAPACAITRAENSRVIKAGILWTDISEGLAPRNDTPATTPIHIKTIITHWMTVLCHIKTIGKGNLLSLKRNSTARKEVEAALLKSMKTCMQNYQGGLKPKGYEGMFNTVRTEVKQLKEQGTWEEPTDDMRQKADKEAREKALAIFGRIKQKAGFVDKKKDVQYYPDPFVTPW
ncbi:hypothetical protein VOLCADRAFT_106337 [Volvox carteri f. nagariensis]|uniref:Uncharacterized protein n=1 Tax=Volvox carteri f. nagariensis TaxID=3068 RepID=D8U6P1_VOLCA|nr:uncharacterized protein VOLCADRAFT_106337 [Volvox carteri f. nagariensis]EFJ44476.1 hypothetical protein VOLCADRAFT_106337 [Volvox carteri f. nagariensis]|eukprot:XP_002954326.1 hypothetical protein VOLCADRAFT_106337 [Volvox carteri f. nagariensis]